MNTQKMPLKNSLCLLLAATIWGIAFVAQSVGMEYVGPFTFNGVRSLIGAAVLVPVIFILNRSKDKASAAAHSPAPESPSTGAKKADTPSPYNSVTSGSEESPAELLSLLPATSSSSASSTTVGKSRFYHCLLYCHCPDYRTFPEKKCSPFIWTAVVMALIGLYLLCITDGFSIGLGRHPGAGMCFPVFLCTFWSLTIFPRRQSG